MTVTVFIPITHRRFVQGNSTLSLDIHALETATLAGALGHLETLFPELDRQIMEDRHALIPGIEIFLNNRPVIPFCPDLTVSDGDEIRMSSIITGG